jgi:uncharacterized C2H2 Zn-finger protein
MTERIRTELERDGELFLSDGKCPECGIDITDEGDGLRLRIGHDGHAELHEVEPGKYEIAYSYDTEDMIETYTCYSCGHRLIEIIKG